MKLLRFFRVWAGLCTLACIPFTAVAEDVDLFLGLPTSSVDAPNVLFIIDNTANWSQTGTDGRPAWTSEAEALARIFRELEEDQVNVGFMFYTETGGADSNTDGAYVRSAIRFMDAATKEKYALQVEAFDINNDKSNGGKAGLAMAEAYLYFSGNSPEAGNGKVKTDYLNNPSGVTAGGTNTVSVTDGDVCGFKGNGDPKTCDVTTVIPAGPTADGAVWALSGNALNSKNGSPYNSPVPANYCGKNYIIYLSNGAAQDNTSDIRRGEAILSSLGGDPTQISITPSGSAKNPADEWSRFMSASDYGITTFTIDVNKVTTGQGPGWTALLKSMAEESGGVYYEADASVNGISDAVNDALSRILGVNSVFASAALPASANTQSTFINQVYIGLFRPDEDAKPRWFGNLKQYKLGFDTSAATPTLKVLDADDSPIIDSGTGFIRECAQSFWTPGSQDSYWSYLADKDQRGDCTAQPGSADSNFPDGPIVEKGGQAYVGRGGSSFASADAVADRTVITTSATLCDSDAGSALTTCSLPDFDTTNVVDSAVDANDPTDHANLIAWAHGADIRDEDGDGDVDEFRPSLHGDIIHSQPIAIDYAADPNDPLVVVFYGGNDGMLRAINGNRTDSHNGTITGTGKPAGGEFWAFMPPDFYDNIKRNYLNSEIVKFPATGASAGASGSQKPYGPDGPLTAYDDEVSTRQLYMGMRRGGRTIYGFDVSTISSPSLLWRLGCTDSVCASGWEDIGETWSPMVPLTVDGDANRYLIMGGGYDDCEDVDDPNSPTKNHDCGTTASPSTDGDKIYVFNATTGQIAQTFDTDRAVPGRVTVVPVSDSDPDIKFAYAADMGGNIYRISGASGAAIGSTSPAATGGWEMTKIASLGCGTTSTASCTANRKFLFGPDVVRVQTTLPLAAEYVVLVGSGDREKPLADYGGAASVQNYFFGIFDMPSDSSNWLSAENTTCGANSICLDSLTLVDPNGPLTDGASIGPKGWALRMRDNEQVVSGALTVSDVVNFSTHIPVQPDAAACTSDLGTATTYNIGFQDGTGDLIPITGGGLVPTPVAGKVILDDGQVVPFCIGCGGENSAIGGSQVTSGASWSQPKSRMYWNIEK